MFGGVSNLEKKYDYLQVEQSQDLVLWRAKKKIKLNWKAKPKNPVNTAQVFAKKKIHKKKKKKILTNFFLLLDKYILQYYEDRKHLSEKCKKDWMLIKEKLLRKRCQEKITFEDDNVTDLKQGEKRMIQADLILNLQINEKIKKGHRKTKSKGKKMIKNVKKK